MLLIVFLIIGKNQSKFQFVAIQGTENDKVGVVSVVYATNDKDLAEQKMNELIAVNPNNYYMIYSVPLNVDLTELSHYPSIAISKDDLQ